MATLLTETFRRVIVTIPVGVDKKNIEEDIKRLFNLPTFKNDFKDVKTEIKPSVKADVIVIDLNGDGADSVSRKVKDIASKFKALVKVRNEKPMGNIKTDTSGALSEEQNSDPKKALQLAALDILSKKHKNAAEVISKNQTKIDQVTSNLLDPQYKTTDNNLKAKVIAKYIEKHFIKDLSEGRAISNISASVLMKLQDELGPEEANELWSSNQEKIKQIMDSTKDALGTSTGQKLASAVEQIKKIQMNENKNVKSKIKHMILEALEQVKAEAKTEEEESEETESSEEVSDDQPKAKKLEKDEIGKFYIVTRPTKAEDNIVHETNVLDLVNKIKGGQIDPSRILGAFKKRGGANALAKIHLKQISAELDELQNHMEEYRNSKKSLNDAKNKAKQTILKYKPASETKPENLDEAKKKVLVKKPIFKGKKVVEKTTKKVVKK